ncbi:MAG: hypothetical protein ACLFQ8_00410 [Candidatus Aenigmatarchaeota archaeon]
MPICDECGTFWKRSSRRFEDGGRILCTDCYVKLRKERDRFDGHGVF